jgi:hypothetical protein
MTRRWLLLLGIVVIVVVLLLVAVMLSGGSHPRPRHGGAPATVFHLEHP